MAYGKTKIISCWLTEWLAGCCARHMSKSTWMANGAGYRHFGSWNCFWSRIKNPLEQYVSAMPAAATAIDTIHGTTDMCRLRSLANTHRPWSRRTILLCAIHFPCTEKGHEDGDEENKLNKMFCVCVCVSCVCLNHSEFGSQRVASRRSHSLTLCRYPACTVNNLWYL